MDIILETVMVYNGRYIYDQRLDKDLVLKRMEMDGTDPKLCKIVYVKHFTGKKDRNKKQYFYYYITNT